MRASPRFQAPAASTTVPGASRPFPVSTATRGRRPRPAAALPFRAARPRPPPGPQRRRPGRTPPDRPRARPDGRSRLRSRSQGRARRHGRPLPSAAPRAPPHASCPRGPPRLVDVERPARDEPGAELLAVEPVESWLASASARIVPVAARSRAGVDAAVKRRSQGRSSTRGASASGPSREGSERRPSRSEAREASGAAWLGHTRPAFPDEQPSVSSGALSSTVTCAPAGRARGRRRDRRRRPRSRPRPLRAP